MKIKNGLVCVLVVSVMYFQQNFICAQAQETLPEGHNGYADATYGDKTKYGNDEEGGFNVFQVTVSAEAWHPVSANVETNVSALIQQRDPLGQSGIQLGWNASLEGVGNVKYGLQVERGDWIVSYRVPDGYDYAYSSNTSKTAIAGQIENATGRFNGEGGISAINRVVYTGDGINSTKVEVNNSLTHNAPEGASEKKFEGQGVYGGGVALDGGIANFSGSYNIPENEICNISAGGNAEITKTVTPNGVSYSVSSKSFSKKP